jgi:hypothetical protein
LSALNKRERLEKIRRIREDEAHRVIGRYIFAFAYLVSQMREAVEYVLSDDSRDSTRMDARLAMGAAFAEQITNAFFAICERQAELDKKETRVAAKLKAMVKDAIADRNDFAHGDWSALWDSEGPTLSRMKPGRKAGAFIEQVWRVEEIDLKADAVLELSEVVTEFAMLCLGFHPLAERTGMAVRVRDIFRLREREVLRVGRYAGLPMYGWEEEDE